MLIVNADDWGRSEETTDRILNCFNKKRIHRVSAMVYMQDSDRAAQIALEQIIPVGLHLNFTQEFTDTEIDVKLKEQHKRILKYLNKSIFSQIIFNPFLLNIFSNVFEAQWDRFEKLYYEIPKRIDGHHHMHLCMNALLSGVYPHGITVRRSFSFFKGEKNILNRFYRNAIDKYIMSKFSSTDYFFSLEPIDTSRLKKIVTLSNNSNVELMVHPGVDIEYNFLLSSEWEAFLR